MIRLYQPDQVIHTFEESMACGCGGLEPMSPESIFGLCGGIYRISLRALLCEQPAPPARFSWNVAGMH